jgi:hypothetical protein
MPTRAGPKSIYKPDEEAWLRPVLAEYLSMVEKEQSLAALRNFRTEKVQAFLLQFEAGLVDTNRDLESEPKTELEHWRKVSETTRVFINHTNKLGI